MVKSLKKQIKIGLPFEMEHTDNEEIAKVSRDCGADVPFLRPIPPSLEFSHDLIPQNQFKPTLCNTMLA